MFTRKLMTLQRKVVTSSVSFDGNDEEMTYLQAAGDSRTFTISMWVKLGEKVPMTLQIMRIGGIVNQFDSSIRLSNTVETPYLTYQAGAGTLIAVEPPPDYGVWSHLVFRYDTTQAVSTDRFRVYFDGVEQVPLANSQPDLNDTTRYNVVNNTFVLGGHASPHFYEGRMAEVNYVDGQSLGPEEFGQTFLGSWVPKTPLVDYGVNGFRLRFLDPNNLGVDTSGNENHLTVTNMDPSNWSSTDIPG